MKRYLIIVFGMILIGGCEPKCQDDPNLTAADLSWVPYTKGQVLIYKSNSGLYDTVVVDSSINYSIGGINGNNCQHVLQYAKYDVGNISIFVTHYNKYAVNTSVFSVDIRYYNDYEISNLTPQNNIVLNGNTYNNVYVVDSIYYTKQKGIIAFQGNPGVQWVLIN
jgi:hypothetical protein